MTDPTNPLHELLSQAADDGDRPLTTDLGDLLGRARRRRNRHHAGVAGAVVVTAAALVGSTVGIRAALPGDAHPAAHESAAGDNASNSASSATLTKAETVRRCLPQLAKYDSFQQYSGTGKRSADQWRLPRDRGYAPGDVVALQSRDGYANAVLCVVPEKGHERDAVPFSSFTGDPTEPARLTELCSELFLPQPKVDFQGGATHGYEKTALPDLRGATLLRVDTAGPVVEALLATGGRKYSCALSPITWDAGPSGVGEVAANGYQLWAEGSTTGPSNKSTVDEDAAYYYAAGTIPKDAARIDVTLDTGTTFRVPVDDGNYAFVHKEAGTDGLVNYDYRVLDDKGRVLHEGTDRM